MLVIDRETEKEVNTLAIMKGLTVNQLLLELVHNDLADIQDATDIRNAYKEFKTSGKASISLDEVIKENGL